MKDRLSHLRPEFVWYECYVNYGPAAIGGHRMVELALSPALPVVVDVDDLVAASGREHMTVAEISVGAGSALEGATLAGGELMKRYGALAIGIIGEDCRLQVGVPPRLRLEGGHVLVVFGTERAIEAMARASRSVSNSRWLV